MRATFGFSALVVSRMHMRSRASDITEGGAAGPLKQMAAGIRAFVSSPPVTLLAGFSILASFVYGTDTVLFVVVSRTNWVPAAPAMDTCWRLSASAAF